MLTLKIYDEDPTFKNVDDAIKYMHKTNFENEITMYDINDSKAYMKTKEIYTAIREYNKGKELSKQILPSYPFGFRGIIGCLGVQCYSISLGTYEENRECISLFTGGWNNSVLDTSTEESNILPGLKALSSLALMAQMLH